VSGPAGNAASALLAQLFEAARSKSNDFASHVHPAWADAAWKGSSEWLAAAPEGAAKHEASLALQGAYNVQWPSLASLADCLQRAALLPRPVLLQLLCASAVFQRRQEVLRCVDRASRKTLMELVGAAAFEVILDANDVVGDTVEPLPSNIVSADTLAAWAFDRLELQGAWSCPQARTLVALSLSPAALGRAQRSHRPKRRAQSLAAFVVRLEKFFPEYVWLFGSDMDRALSA
jgi:hypothetical protein